jgi:2-methylisocitrate lyase-like PEP mutase family enzyme
LELGFSIALYAVTTLFSAAKAMSDVLATLKQSGRSEHAAGTMLNYDEFCRLVDLDFHQELDNRFGD